MNIEDLISHYLDGELSPDAEAEMHYQLSLSPEGRKLFREHMALRGAAHDRGLLLQPTPEMRSSLFGRLAEEGMSRATAGEAAGMPEAVLHPLAEPLAPGLAATLPRSTSLLVRWGIPALCVAAAAIIFARIGPEQAHMTSLPAPAIAAAPRSDAPRADIERNRSNAVSTGESAGMAEMPVSAPRDQSGIPASRPARSSAIGHVSDFRGSSRTSVGDGAERTREDFGAARSNNAPAATIADTAATAPKMAPNVQPAEVIEQPKPAEHAQGVNMEGANAARMAATVDSLNSMLRAHARESTELAQEQGENLVPFVGAQGGLLAGGSGMPGPDYALRVGVEFPGGNHQLYAMFGSSGVRITDRTVVSAIIFHDTTGTSPGTIPAAQSSEIVQRDLWYGLGYRYSILLAEHTRLGGAVEGGIGGHYFRIGAALPLSYDLNGVLRLEFAPKLQYASAIGETITTTSSLVDITPHRVEQQERSQALTALNGIRLGAEFGVSFLFR